MASVLSHQRWRSPKVESELAELALPVLVDTAADQAALIKLARRPQEQHHVGVLLDRAGVSRSASVRRLTARFSTSRLSCDSAITATCMSFARALSPRLISSISLLQLLPLWVLAQSCR